MVHITLPTGKRRAALRSFWFILSVGLGAAVSMSGWWLGWQVSTTCGALAALATASLAFFKEPLIWRFYCAWNRRVVRPIAKATSTAILAICYFIVFVAVGRAGLRPRSGVPLSETSAWMPRSALPADTFRTTFAGSHASGTAGGWIANYLVWARQTGNLWAVSLIPFLAVLKVFTPEEEREVDGSIYTLF